MAPGITVRRRNTQFRPGFQPEALETRVVPSASPGVAAHVAVANGGARAQVHAAADTPAVSITDGTVLLGRSGKGATVMSYVTLSTASTNRIALQYNTSAVTANDSGPLREFVPKQGTLIIPKNSLYGVIRTKVLRPGPGTDVVYNVNLTSATNATLQNDASGHAPFSRIVIRDNRLPVTARPTLSVSGSTVTEGSAATFTLTLSSATSRDVSVRYTTVPGTASTSRYVGTAGIATIPAGQTSATISVPTVNDPAASGTQTFSMYISTAANAYLSTFVANANINDTATA